MFKEGQKLKAKTDLSASSAKFGGNQSDFKIIAEGCTFKAYFDDESKYMHVEFKRPFDTDVYTYSVISEEFIPATPKPTIILSGD